MSVQDNNIKAGIFPGKVIIVENGKLVRHERAWCYREGVRNCARDGGGPPGGGPGVQGPGQFFAAQADKGGRLLDGDPGRLRHLGTGLGLGHPFHHHPAGQAQALLLARPRATRS